jgi:predicted sulfurtransferase
VSFIQSKPSTVLIALSFVFGLSSFAPSARGIHSTELTQAPGDGIQRITPEEVREALKKGKAILIDVRNEASYKAGHIKGAHSIPLSELESRVKELPRKKMIITYCS